MLGITKFKVILFSQSLPGTLSQIMQAVKAHGLGGVIAKRLDSKYHPIAAATTGSSSR